MSAPPFSLYRRRVVRLPDGESALLVVRRNVNAKYSNLNIDVRWELTHIWRAVRRDRRWRVELYVGISQDPQSTPHQMADQAWVLPGREQANAWAERLSGLLQAGGLSDLDASSVSSGATRVDG
ncbi:MAG: hypothetical protein JWM05_1262 [Acidimicrobiales bacterium]|nr:hypothetical protein [Acidimicrobiales bacterium]